MSEKKIDLSQYDVTVAQGIWLGGRIIGVGTYRTPNIVPELVEFAKTQVEEPKPLAYFSLDGDKVNPFLVLENLEIPDDGTGKENKDGNGELDIESMFKSADEFSSLSDKNQTKYIGDIKDAPTEFSEDESEEYDKVLFNKLTDYKAVAKTKALVEIESVLALYDEN